MADMLSKFLLSSSFVATSIHGDCTQREHEMAVQTFRQGRTPILVATTVAARGLDILNVTHVINYGLSSDIDDHVYRIGHTGRAGNTEISTAFFNQRVTTTSLVVDTVALVDDQPVMVDMAAATLEVEVQQLVVNTVPNPQPGLSLVRCQLQIHTPFVFAFVICVLSQRRAPILSPALPLTPHANMLSLPPTPPAVQQSPSLPSHLLPQVRRRRPRSPFPPFHHRQCVTVLSRTPHAFPGTALHKVG